MPFCYCRYTDLHFPTPIHNSEKNKKQKKLWLVEKTYTAPYKFPTAHVLRMTLLALTYANAIQWSFRLLLYSVV